MKFYTKKDLENYLKNDWILKELSKYPQDDNYLSQKWLLDMPEKRMIYADVYGELLNSEGKKVLDIGGGFCGLSRELSKRHDYTVVDIIEGKDWSGYILDGEYDFMIANDLFPNVDQRLKKFLEIYKPHAKKMILTLTCHEGDKFYRVKRLDVDEVLTVVPWSAAFTSLIIGQDLPTQAPEFSVFKNGRTVYRVDL